MVNKLNKGSMTLSEIMIIGPHFCLPQTIGNTIVSTCTVHHYTVSGDTAMLLPLTYIAFLVLVFFGNFDEQREALPHNNQASSAVISANKW